MRALNEIHGRESIAPKLSSMGQRMALNSLCGAYQDLGPPPDRSAAAAFRELCGSHPGYVVEDAMAGKASFKRDRVSLPRLASPSPTVRAC